MLLSQMFSCLGPLPSSVAGRATRGDTQQVLPSPSSPLEVPRGGRLKLQWKLRGNESDMPECTQRIRLWTTQAWGRASRDVASKDYED